MVLYDRQTPLYFRTFPKCVAIGPSVRADKKRLGCEMIEDKTRAAKEAPSDHTGPPSGGIKVNLGVPDAIEICGRT